MADHATIDEFMHALADMKPAERAEIAARARAHIGGTPYSSGTDILHEAIYRTLSGRRQWPMAVPVAAYLIETARSLGSGARGKLGASHERFDDSLHLAGDGLDWPPAGHLSAQADAESREVARLGKEACAFARRAMANDVVGLRVLEGLAEGWTAEEMRDAFDLDEKTFHAARSRVGKRLRTWAAMRPQLRSCLRH